MSSTDIIKLHDEGDRIEGKFHDDYYREDYVTLDDTIFDYDPTYQPGRGGSLTDDMIHTNDVHLTKDYN